MANVKTKAPEGLIRKLWIGGEHRRAAEEFVAAKFKEATADALMADLPGLREQVERVRV